jgi:hypothetical protein
MHVRDRHRVFLDPLHTSTRLRTCIHIYKRRHINTLTHMRTHLCSHASTRAGNASEGAGSVCVCARTHTRTFECSIAFSERWGCFCPLLFADLRYLVCLDAGFSQLGGAPYKQLGTSVTRYPPRISPDEGSATSAINTLVLPRCCTVELLYIKIVMQEP